MKVGGAAVAAVAAAVAAVALLPGGSALDNGLALTPPMGYNGLRTPRLPRASPARFAPIEAAPATRARPLLRASGLADRQR